jgi:Ca-activated chloride channel family protein
VPARDEANAEPLEYHGAPVLSRRSDEALAAVARETGGAFIPLGVATADLGALFASRLDPLTREHVLASPGREPAARFGLFVAAAVALVIAASRPARARIAGPLVALGLGWAAALGASPNDDATEAVAAGRAAFAAGRIDEALASFERAGTLAPESPVARFDAGVALDRLGRFAEAREAFQNARARSPGGSLMRAKAEFALGNVALALGEPAEAIGWYDACIASPAPGLDADRLRADAVENRRYAAEHLADETPDIGKEPGPTPRGRRGSAEREGPAGGSSPREGSDDPSQPSAGRGRAGGGGGSASEPPRPGSPEGRLASALDEVRRARSGRIQASELPETPGDRKDW